MGPHVAAGYWNDAPATARAFAARLAGEGPFLRTGDLGFLQDGELFVTGRCKEMILVRGRNHYPHDVEATVEASHPAVCKGCSAAFAIEADDEEQLVVAAEVDKRSGEVDEGEVARAIRRAVAEEHELGVHAVVLLRRGAIPKTSSGKIQRHACRDAFLGGSFQGERFRSLAEPVSRGQEAGRAPARRCSRRPRRSAGRSWRPTSARRWPRRLGPRRPGSTRTHP
jgi:acyl-CoA synthetase (AMP-forming)/AMP-acid ligase II